MNITAYFTLDSAAVTGLSPLLKIVDVSADTVVVSGQEMVELVNAVGWYKYDFTAYDPDVDYICIADAGTDFVDDRFPTTATLLKAGDFMEYNRDA